MSINKVVYGSTTLIDLTNSTLNSPTQLLSGVTAYTRAGTLITGTASVNPTLQSKTVAPSESAQTVTADSGYDGLSSVAVSAISTTYVGSGITRRTASDLTASAATVTAPAGYYSADVSKSVATATQATPTISVSAAGLITASATQTAGYVTAGTKSATNQLTTQAAVTITPNNITQSVGAAGRYMTGVVTVNPVPSPYVDTSSGTATADKINSGYIAYVNGSQVTGTQVVQTYYTGTTEPSSSLGSNGDIYLMTEA